MSYLLLHKSQRNISKNINGSTVIDIGAFSVMAALKGAKVFAFEPNPKVFFYLIENIKGLNVHATQLGVSDKPGKKEFFVVPGLGSSLTNNNGKKVTIECTNLKEIFHINKIKKVDYLKIDAEGAEYEVLLNAPIEILNKIKEIGMEYHTIPGHNVGELIKLLKGAGFKVSTKKKHSGMGIISAIR